MTRESYQRRFRDAWLESPDFQSWLKKVPDNENLAYCQRCDKTLSARVSILKKHQNSVDHIRGIQRAGKNRLYLSAGPHNRTTPLKIKSKMKSVNKTPLVQPPVLSSELQQSKIPAEFFSLILHQQVNDIGLNRVSVVTKYFNAEENKMAYQLLKNFTVQLSAGDELSKRIEDMLREFGLDKTKLVGLAADNSSELSQSNETLLKSLSQDTSTLLFVPCTCYSLLLAAGKAIQRHIPDTVEDLVRQTFRWYMASLPTAPNRNRRLLETMCRDMKPPALGIKWAAMYEALKRIDENWSEIESNLFYCAQEENSYEIYTLYINRKNRAYIKYLLQALRNVARIDSFFCHPTPLDPRQTLYEFVLAVKVLYHQIVAEEHLMQQDFATCTDIQHRVDPNFSFDPEIEEFVRSLNLSEVEVMEVKQNCLQFSVMLFEEMQRRLPADTTLIDSLSALESIFTSVNQRPPLRNLLTTFGSLSGNRQELVAQWNLLFAYRDDFISADGNTQQAWLKALNYRDAASNQIFREIASFALRLLTIPFSNAQVEEIFAKLSIGSTVDGQYGVVEIYNGAGNYSSGSEDKEMEEDYPFLNMVTIKDCSSTSATPGGDGNDNGNDDDEGDSGDSLPESLTVAAGDQMFMVANNMLASSSNCDYSKDSYIELFKGKTEEEDGDEEDDDGDDNGNPNTTVNSESNQAHEKEGDEPSMDQHQQLLVAEEQVDIEIVQEAAKEQEEQEEEES